MKRNDNLEGLRIQPIVRLIGKQQNMKIDYSMQVWGEDKFRNTSGDAARN